MRRAAAAEGACTVTLCRGCCCGTADKHPGVDHDGQLARLRAALTGHRVRVSECLNACERSNVVVVQPSPRARRAGARPYWVGWVLDEAAARHIAHWVGAGGPGVAAPPPAVELARFAAPRWGRLAGDRRNG